MRLQRVRVTRFRNVVDSQQIDIRPGVTCLVGKNEAGKTALLRAIAFLNPVPAFEVDVTLDYPRWRMVRDRREQDLEDVVLAQGTFLLSDGDREAVAALFRPALPPGALLQVERTYGGTTSLHLEIPEETWVEYLVKRSELEVDAQAQLATSTLDELIGAVGERLEPLDGRTREARLYQRLRSDAGKAKRVLNPRVTDEAYEVLVSRLPGFFYFDHYNQLEGRIDITDLLRRNEATLGPSERTALALLRMAGVDGQELTEDEFEERIAQLEAAASEITGQVFRYWSQNREIRVDMVGDSEAVPAPGPPGNLQVVHRYVDIRIRDERHHVTTNFSSRSTGFQWFFSFVAAFSELAGTEDLVILLDEPGLGLHARAQGDLLRYIDEALAREGQVIYTAHSPFMVNPKQLDRVRLVEDRSSSEDPDVGARVSADVLSVDGDTLFPLQAALGYDLAQNLFVGKFNLVIEGPSDLIYLTQLSQRLKAQQRKGLDDRWVLVPVGGADKLPTFVALLGAHVDVSVLVDSRTAPNQRLQHLIAQGILEGSRLVSVGRAAGKSDADIEDLFEPGEYLGLYNSTYGKSVKAKDLGGTDGVLKQIERVVGGKFDHLLPATHMISAGEGFLASLSPDTLDRFEALFELINGTLEEE